MVCISGNYINAMDDNMEYNTQQIMNDFNVFKNENEDMYCFGVEEYKVVIDDNTGECYSYNVSRGDNMRLEIKKWNNNIFMYWNHTLIDKFNNMQNKNELFNAYNFEKYHDVYLMISRLAAPSYINYQKLLLDESRNCINKSPLKNYRQILMKILLHDFNIDYYNKDQDPILSNIKLHYLTDYYICNSKKPYFSLLEWLFFAAIRKNNNFLQVNKSFSTNVIKTYINMIANTMYNDPKTQYENDTISNKIYSKVTEFIKYWLSIASKTNYNLDNNLNNINLLTYHGNNENISFNIENIHNITNKEIDETFNIKELISSTVNDKMRELYRFQHEIRTYALNNSCEEYQHPDNNLNNRILYLTNEIYNCINNPSEFISKKYLPTKNIQMLATAIQTLEDENITLPLKKEEVEEYKNSFQENKQQIEQMLKDCIMNLENIDIKKYKQLFSKMQLYLLNSAYYSIFKGFDNKKYGYSYGNEEFVGKFYNFLNRINSTYEHGYYENNNINEINKLTYISILKFLLRLTINEMVMDKNSKYDILNKYNIIIADIIMRINELYVNGKVISSEDHNKCLSIKEPSYGPIYNDKIYKALLGKLTNNSNKEQLLYYYLYSFSSVCSNAVPDMLPKDNDDENTKCDKITKFVNNYILSENKKLENNINYKAHMKIINTILNRIVDIKCKNIFDKYKDKDFVHINPNKIEGNERELYKDCLKEVYDLFSFVNIASHKILYKKYGVHANNQQIFNNNNRLGNMSNNDLLVRFYNTFNIGEKFSDSFKNIATENDGLINSVTNFFHPEDLKTFVNFVFGRHYNEEAIQYIEEAEQMNQKDANNETKITRLNILPRLARNPHNIITKYL